ncbi:conserved hypothetical protein [Histoplasma capsulatum var. duboisii H88]|uniref:Cohesin loading factor domain-containing protein n=1 Tax=Ajellomyces capsulatus (strain H88) TaxID=544711 RepID=F0UV38_AJEC8|nr:conserved hypothetical protein [Histoplasma capsulatum var. duboisii H88]QSS51020.1 cohesin loading factor domain-containing protein [Histoplasma capsulatum var. duboisii H88]
MPYQPPHGGQYPSHSESFQAQQPPRIPPPRHQHNFGPNSANAIYPKPLVHPQAIFPAPPYAPQQQQHAPHPQQQPPNPPVNYAPRPIQARPPPPANNTHLHYGGVPPPPQYFPIQSRPDTHPSPQEYSAQLPQQSQSKFQPTSYPPPPHMYPPQVIIPRPPALHQYRTVDAVQQQAAPLPNSQLKRSQSLKHMCSKSPTKMPQPQPLPATPGKPAIDYHVLLLSLADEYIDAAHSQGTALAVAREEAETNEYYKLIATGLACLEAVLKTWKLPPRTEALVRLRYARILYEETENDSEAETALSKGVDLCERNRMYDLKYCMQQLLARILYKSNPKAAMKHVDGVVRDAEGYRHTAWEYAFRFLRVTLSLSSSAQQDTAAAIQNLQKVASLASRSGDKAILVVSSVIEALVRLQHSSSHDSIEQAQRALATARSYQLDNKVLDIPQIRTMIQMMDICCSLLEYDVKQSSEKLQIMQKVMDQKIDDPHWQNDGSFSLPLSRKTMSPSATESTDILQVEDGNVMLMMRWLPEHDIYALCYFLSSVTLTAKNSQDGHKSEKYLSEGLKMIRSNYKSPQEIPESLAYATERIEWRRSLYCNMLLQLIFLACARTDWAFARQTLKELRSTVSELGTNVNEATICLMEYASGIISQGTGELKAALATFQQPIFALNQATSKSARNDPRRDTAILAALNSALILRDPARPSHSHSAASKVLSTIEPFCRVSPNKYIQAAYFLISATTHTESTIQTKHDLHHSLQAAIAIGNSQVTCIALTFMSWKYFRGVVGEQSEKSAKAARAMARKADDKLWISVTEDLLAATLDSQGKSREAHATREQADMALLGLPPVLKKMKSSSSSNSNKAHDQGGDGGGRSSSEMIMKAVEI